MRWHNDPTSIVENYFYAKSLSKELDEELLTEHDPFEDFIAKLVVLGKIEVEDWDRETGKHYGIPKCCVEWYITLDKIGIHDQGGYMDRMYGEDVSKAGYVRCPKCVNAHP
jgi:hypothetical protein